MAARRSSADAVVSDPEATPIPAADATSFSDWIAGALERGIQPEQALAVVGLGLLRGMGGAGGDLPLLDSESEAEGTASIPALKARLEAIALAIQTGAPLSTQEVAALLGARPGTAQVRRAGVTATRISRNVWQLSRSASEERGIAPGFPEGFRRRL